MGPCHRNINNSPAPGNPLAAGTRVLRSFNPNMAQMAHGMRVDRHGNIWVTDSFLNLV